MVLEVRTKFEMKTKSLFKETQFKKRGQQFTELHNSSVIHSKLFLNYHF